MTSKNSFRLLRRLLSVSVAAGALLLGVVAHADSGHGTFSIAGVAGVGANYSNPVAVKGDGKFTLVGDAANVVLKAKAADILMRDGLQSYTVGENSRIGLKSSNVITLTVAKSDLKLPEAGQQAASVAPGKLSMLGKTSTVTVKYVASEEGGKYAISLAGFDFDYTKHTADGERACLMLVCVRPMVTIATSSAIVEVSR